jgi:redox-sensitive bicupin YhaK (pirin superfamily)
MITLRKSDERGHADHGWLKSQHSFSFADYHDPAHMGFRSLRVINEDRVQPGMGFGTHPHRDMEILTYILEGSLAHKDSMGNGRTISAGQLQTMSAGSGIFHSEFNASAKEPVHFIQIWIRPNQRGLTPSYAEWNPPADTSSRKQTLLASPDGREDSACIAQDALLWLVKLLPGEHLEEAIDTSRGIWVQVMRGSMEVNGHLLEEGGAAALEDEARLVISSASGAEALVFDLA